MIANRIDRRIGRLAVGLALTVGLLLATPAMAQTTHLNEKQPVAFTIVNECVPEQVAFEGFIHFVENTQLRSEGTVHFIASDKFNAAGVGQSTGVQYSVGGQIQINTVFDPDGGFLKLRERTKVVSQGPTDNFFTTFVFRVEGDGNVSKLQFEADCRG